MKIAYISSSNIPSRTANSIQVMKMCQALVQQGHEVELLAPRYQIDPALRDTDIWHHYGIDMRFPIRWLPSPGRLGRSFYSLATAAYARCSGAYLAYGRHLAGIALAAQMGIPSIYEVHDAPQGRMVHVYFKVFLQSAGFRRVVVISEPLKHLLSSIYPRLSEGHIVVAPDGVDLERFRDLPVPKDARRKLRLNPMHLTVGYCGHLHAERGIELILELARRCPQVHFLIVGGNPGDVAGYKQQTDTSGISNVSFEGFVPNSELPAYLAACDVLLMPYQRRVAVGGGVGDTSRWMSPMKMFEYMACDRLIIASDLPVLREVLNESNAVLCGPEDVDAWKRTLERAAVDIAWRESLGRQARQDVEQYSWRCRVERCLEMIR